MSTKKDVGYRPRLTEEESEMINSHRALRVECETNGIPMSDVIHYWHKAILIFCFYFQKLPSAVADLR